MTTFQWSIQGFCKDWLPTPIVKDKTTTQIATDDDLQCPDNVFFSRQTEYDQLALIPTWDK